MHLLLQCQLLYSRFASTDPWKLPHDSHQNKVQQTLNAVPMISLAAKLIRLSQKFYPWKVLDLFGKS
jgi:hypothetical protein